jgi:putative sterol carrier protein
VVRYLSDEWMQRAGDALAGDASLAEATAEVDLSVAYEVTGGPEGKRAYTVRLQHGAVSLEPAAADGADVTFALEYPTAAAIARGELSVPTAFMRGDLKLAGDVAVLVRDAAALEGIGDALAGLRSDTEY